MALHHLRAVPTPARRQKLSLHRPLKLIIILLMLLSTPSLLAQHVAGIHAELRAEADHHAAQAGVIAALHALILTALARLFARLDDLLALWQAGQLPPLIARAPASRPKSAVNLRVRATSTRRRTPAARATTSETTPATRISAPSSPRPQHAARPVSAPKTGPPPRPAFPRQSAPSSEGPTMLVSLRLRNYKSKSSNRPPSF